MPNPFEAFWKALKTNTDNDSKAPLHVGEVMAIWTYFTAVNEMLRYEEMGLNTTKNEEVKEMLTDAHKMCLSQSERLESFLIKEGVPLPETSPPKPDNVIDDIPHGIKVTDDEIANGVSLKIASAIVECAMGQAQSIRTDVGMMWAEFQSEMLTFSTSLKALMRKHGWLKIPPYYYPSSDKKSY
ncbi:DUF3231 family protein [Bacillus shivajii]|uniref:DUF3231 family protein n=1 Tax=Bacillus shivajii TaxID=1983719 RepID=UPI001CFA0E20|nr:DUF3231 family protein [Bacillus shivajii]UCZ53925.1 DUF3231 family protein [Bacillus shivajii]